MNRKGLTSGEIEKRILITEKAFPDAKVTSYEHIIGTLDLPDQKDRHVLAAAITCGARFIITNNLKDFPSDYLNVFNIQAKSPDKFLADLIDLKPDKALEAFTAMVENKKRPPMEIQEALKVLSKIGLNLTSKSLLALI